MPDNRNQADAAQHGEFSTDWFHHNIAHWHEWLDGFADQSGLRALEVGSFEGRSAMWLCQNILTEADSRIDCVDFFSPDPVYGDYHARFVDNVAPWAHKITEHAMPSADAFRQLHGPYDIIYIDGWHSAFGALADGVMAWPMLRVGGVLIFDDYIWVPPKMPVPKRPNKLLRKWLRWRGKQWYQHAMQKQMASVATQTPKLGVDSLLRTLEGCYELLGVTNQLAVRKTAGFNQGQVGQDT